MSWENPEGYQGVFERIFEKGDGIMANKKTKIGKMRFDEVFDLAKGVCDNLRIHGYKDLEILIILQMAVETMRFDSIARNHDAGNLTLKNKRKKK